MNQQLYQIDLLLQINDIRQQIAQVQSEIQLTQRRKAGTQEINQKLRSRWNAQEDQLLVSKVKLFGIHNYQEIAQNIPNKTASQVYFRLRYLKSIFQQDKEVYQNKTDLQWLGEISVNNNK
ncbi:SANT/Myb_domain [Hexamita inflata]|uniref:SANT/Myb domain n=1 Tax=Hexamita inflata TaxID=28002 RepID=A0AA86U867_9EUKA|nr:SANT/Myb domain [Hexamita inflata]